MFTYQALCKPFKEDLVNLLCILNEGILFAISMIQMIFVIKTDNVETIDMTGWVMISMVLIMISINFILILVYSLNARFKKCCVKKIKVDHEIDPIALGLPRTGFETTTSRIQTMSRSFNRNKSKSEGKWVRPVRRFD